MGRLLHSTGAMYDDSFPHELKLWIASYANVGNEQAIQKEEEEGAVCDENDIRALISQLLLAHSMFEA